MTPKYEHDLTLSIGQLEKEHAALLSLNTKLAERVEDQRIIVKLGQAKKQTIDELLSRLAASSAAASRLAEDIGERRSELDAGRKQAEAARQLAERAAQATTRRALCERLAPLLGELAKVAVWLGEMPGALATIESWSAGLGSQRLCSNSSPRATLAHVAEDLARGQGEFLSAAIYPENGGWTDM